MNQNIFELPGKFYRGDLHSHSTHLDGALEPEEGCRRYRNEGYDYVCLSDHFVGRYSCLITDTGFACDREFSAILAAELHSGAMHNGELWHLSAVGLPTDFVPPEVPGFVPVAGGRSPACRLQGGRVMPVPLWP